MLTWDSSILSERQTQLSSWTQWRIYIKRSKTLRATQNDKVRFFVPPEWYWFCHPERSEGSILMLTWDSSFPQNDKVRFFDSLRMTKKQLSFWMSLATWRIYIIDCFRFFGSLRMTKKQLSFWTRVAQWRISIIV